jgi:enediyne biosynthesis protein E4
MTDLKTPENMQPDEVVGEEELVPADDTIIAKAFGWSLAVFAVFGIGIGVVVFALREPPPRPAIEPAKFTPPKTIASSVTAPLVTFTDITKEAGINFTHNNGATGDKLLPETMGGGCAFLDFDNDHDQDIILVNSTSWRDDSTDAARTLASSPPHALYRNDGAGKFENITAGSGLDFSSYGMGIACADYDNDGDVDVFITNVGPNILLRNEGSGHFTNVTEQAQVGGADDAWSTGAGFFDYDNDGDLDLFVVNYVKWSREIDFAVNFTLTGVGRAYGPPTNFQGSHNYLYNNNGDGTFSDISEAAGIQVKTVLGAPMGKGLGLAIADVDRDGYLDVFVANDTVQRFLFHNQKDGTFTERGAEFGMAFDRAGNSTGAMGVDCAHYRNDDALGFVIGNFANEMSSLLVSQSEPTQFTDEAITEGIGSPTRSRLTFGAFFFDYDLDGRTDILHANGHIEDQINLVQSSQQYRQPAQLFWNAGPDAKACFVEAPADSVGDLNSPIVGRGAAYADIDGDGDLDVLLTQAGGPPKLLRNDLEADANRIRIQLVNDPSKGNRDAIGAVVKLTAGGITQTQTVMPTRSYLSQVELPLTFGLGESDSIDELTIRWPDGTTQTVTDAKIGQLNLIRKAPPPTSNAGGGSRTHTPLRGTGF